MVQEREVGSLRNASCDSQAVESEGRTGFLLGVVCALYMAEKGHGSQARTLQGPKSTPLVSVDHSCVNSRFALGHG